MDDLLQRWDDLQGPIVRVEQAAPAPPAAVHEAWLDPARLRDWWWPMWPDTTYEIDPQVGGRYRIHSAAADFGVSGTYLYLGREDAPEIWMTWNWSADGPGEAPEELVRVRFDPQETFGTNVVMEHKLADPDADTTNPTQGWTDVMARLA